MSAHVSVMWHVRVSYVMCHMSYILSSHVSCHLASSSSSNACWNAITYKVRLCGVPIPLLFLIAIPLALGFGWRYEAGELMCQVMMAGGGAVRCGEG